MSTRGVSVGDVFEVTRYFSTGGGKKVDSGYRCEVVKVTPKRAYFANGKWFALNDPKRVVKPDYCDYVTVAAEVPQ